MAFPARRTAGFAVENAATDTKPTAEKRSWMPSRPSRNDRAESPLPAHAGARIGMIIPSVNSMTEPQFNHFAPPGLAVHVARARVAGEWKRPLAAMADEIATSAKLLSDVAPDLIVFHCTDTSMTQGPQGEGRILDIVQGRNRHRGARHQPAGARSLAGARASRSSSLLSPYREQPGGHRLSARRPASPSCTTWRSACNSLEFANVTPRGMDRARAPARPAGGRRHLPELHQHHADRGDRGYRARARQTGGQQQPGGAVGLREAAQVGARAAAADAGAWAR